MTGLFAKLGIGCRRTTPRVSSDNHYSEAWFKTAKYAPTYPTYFTDIDQARIWATELLMGVDEFSEGTAAERDRALVTVASSTGTTTITGTPIWRDTPQPLSTTAPGAHHRRVAP